MRQEISPQEVRPRGGRDAWWRRRRSGRMQAGLVALSSVAIASVYAVGYAETEVDQTPFAQALQLDSTVEPTATATPSPLPTTVPRAQGATGRAGTSRQPVLQPGGVGGQATPVPTPSNSTRPATYRDGTYVGLGSSRHGSIEATVVVRGGVVVSAEITSCATRYPCTKVASLPAIVLARQGATSDYVSGATDSSRAYMTAVAGALTQARGA